MSSNSETDGSQLPHPSYEETDRKSYGSQKEVADAWADGKFPTHNVFSSGESVLYTGSPDGNLTGGRRRRGLGGRTSRRSSSSSSSSSDGPKGKSANFYAVQRTDGSGTLWHYQTREAWRTHSGMVISNQQCWSGGFAHCSPPGDYDVELPYSALESLYMDPYTVERVIGQPHDVYREFSDTTSTLRRARNSIVVFEDGSAVAIGHDSTATYGEPHFVTELDEVDLRLFKTKYDDPDSDDVEEFINEMLRPQEVYTSDYDVVGSNEYTKTVLSDEEREAHEEAGGKTHTSQSRWRDTLMNLQSFRADLQGEVIVRQGEWFFIPTDRTDVPEQGCSYASKQMSSHRAQRFHGARSPLPTECPECASNMIECDGDGDLSCGTCGREIDREILVRGLVSHSRNEHNQIHLGDTWHKAVTHGRDVLTYDDNPGNGGGGGGWD